MVEEPLGIPCGRLRWRYWRGVVESRGLGSSSILWSGELLEEAWLDLALPGAGGGGVDDLVLAVRLLFGVAFSPSVLARTVELLVVFKDVCMLSSAAALRLRETAIARDGGKGGGLIVMLKVRAVTFTRGVAALDVNASDQFNSTRHDTTLRHHFSPTTSFSLALENHSDQEPPAPACRLSSQFHCLVDSTWPSYPSHLPREAIPMLNS
ncbi:9086_t:CDS:2, partial [Scutellospora calospora]